MLLPGLGHWYRKFYDKAFFIASSFLFHIALAYTLLHVLVIEQPLTIAFIMLILPYHYFYAIFNSLQSFDGSSPHRLSWVKITLSIILLLLSLSLFLPIGQAYAFKIQIVYHYPMIIMLSIVVYLATHMTSKKNGHIFAGRFTVCLLMVLLAILLWLHNVAPIQWIQWLYVTPILLLLEIIALWIYRYWMNDSTIFRLDFWSLLVIIVISGTSYFVIQYSDYPTKILQSFHAPPVNNEQLDIEQGFRYELAPIKLPADATGKVQFRHLNGYVEIIRDEVEELTIYPTLYVNTEDEEKALEVKQQSYIDVNFSDGINLQSYLPLYNSNSYPRMNVKIVIPNDYDLGKGMTIKLDHGALHMKGINVGNKLVIESNSAAINVYQLIGDIEISNKKGNIFLKDVNGKINVQSKNGSITLINPYREVQATALNGSLYVKSSKVAGNWNLTATVGSIVTKMPKNSHYSLSAKVSFGKISGGNSDIENRKRYETTVGAAIYSISMYASNYILLE